MIVNEVSVEWAPTGQSGADLTQTLSADQGRGRRPYVRFRGEDVQ